MYIRDGIAYGGEETPSITVCGVKPMPGHRLRLRFSDGQIRVFDFTPLLEEPAFRALKDESVFNDVYIDYGVTVWLDGEIDIAPEYLFSHSVDLFETAS